MADVKWIKITTDIFDDEKIILIESLPDAYAIITVWFKLLCLAGKQNNSGVFLLGRMPYTDKMLATIFRMKESTVTMALQTFESFGMIQIIDGVITIPNWGKHQNLDQLESKKEYMRGYMREYRAKQKALTSGKTNGKAKVSQADKEEDKDIDKELDNKKERVSATPTPAAEPPSVDYEQFKNLYNEICTNLPHVKMLSEKRKKAIRGFLKQLKVDDFKAVCKKANESDFLTGKNDREWKADFDFLVRVDKAISILEGKYSNNKESGSFETDEFYEAALRKACGNELYEQVYGKPKPKTAAEDPAIREKADALKGALQNG
jgi:predicted phage replisome organizer